VREKEIIRLDAKVVGVIADAVFRAELGNGHRLVAYPAPADREKARELALGTGIRVEMSPFDMSRGRIVLDEK